MQLDFAEHHADRNCGLCLGSVSNFYRLGRGLLTITGMQNKGACFGNNPRCWHELTKLALKQIRIRQRPRLSWRATFPVKSWQIRGPFWRQRPLLLDQGKIQKNVMLSRALCQCQHRLSFAFFNVKNISLFFVIVPFFGFHGIIVDFSMKNCILLRQPTAWTRKGCGLCKTNVGFRALFLHYFWHPVLCFEHFTTELIWPVFNEKNERHLSDNECIDNLPCTFPLTGIGSPVARFCRHWTWSKIHWRLFIELRFYDAFKCAHKNSPRFRRHSHPLYLYCQYRFRALFFPIWQSWKCINGTCNVARSVLHCSCIAARTIVTTASVQCGRVLFKTRTVRRKQEK